MNKSFALAILVCGLLSTVTVAAGKTSLLDSDTLIWAGIDYSMTRMIGPGEFRDPEAIFPKMLETWNDLFLRERIRVVEKTTHKQVLPDIGGVSKANQSASAKQIATSVGARDTVEQTHITPEMIAGAVKSYQMANQSGLGVVFIADRFVKVGQKAGGAVYVVVFDVGTREVLSSQREVSKPSGFGFRNYWFRPIKNAEGALKKLR